MSEWLIIGMECLLHYALLMELYWLADVSLALFFASLLVLYACDSVVTV